MGDAPVDVWGAAVTRAQMESLRPGDWVRYAVEADTRYHRGRVLLVTPHGVLLAPTPLTNQPFTVHTLFAPAELLEVVE